MMAYARVLVVFAAILLIPGYVMAAPGATPPAPAMESLTQDIIILALSDPDESWGSLVGKIDKSVWSAAIDRGTSVAGSTRISTAAALGMQSVNAMAASLIGDNSATEKLSASVKDLAVSLNVYTPDMETLVGKLNKDLKENDSAKRDAVVRKDLNLLRMQVVSALDALGNGAESTILIFGAWSESIRLASAALSSKYDSQSSGILARSSEADYFFQKLTILSKASPLFDGLTPGIKAVSAAMKPTNHQVPIASVKAINMEAAKLAALLKK